MTLLPEHPADVRTSAALSVLRLNLMRVGYALMAVGLAAVQCRGWPAPTTCRCSKVSWCAC